MKDKGLGVSRNTNTDDKDLRVLWGMGVQAPLGIGWS